MAQERRGTVAVTRNNTGTHNHTATRGGSGAVRRGNGNQRTSRANAAARARAAARGEFYVYDNTVRSVEVRRQLEEVPRKQLSLATRKNRDKAHHMNPGYVLFLMGALLVCGIVLVNYIALQSEITAKVKQVSRLESELNTLQLANEENYNRVVRNVDLEEIRKIAIGELGMTYAKEGQIITYENSGYDYMRRVSE